MVRTLPRLLLAALALPAAPALAQPDGQSAFGCSQLESATPTAYVEGRDGAFFRLTLDLRLSHPVTDGSVALVARLSDALAERGTTLVYVPLPARGAAMPEYLPPEAAAYGFDPVLAAEQYRDAVARLDAAGVVTVDALSPMLALPPGEMAFIPTDHHWTAAGARAVAGAVADAIAATPGAAGLPRAETRTTDLGPTELPSPFRREVQSMCRDTVPPAATEAFETVVTPAADPADIFATDAAAPPVALVGTSMSRTDAFNFDGFIAEASGLDVANYAVTGGNQFGALTSYLLSDAFADAPPRVLVWENPIYNNLGEFGEQPLRELIAAAGATCTELPVERPEPDRLVAAIPDGALTPDATIRADAGAARGRSVDFALDTADGLRVEASIERGARLDPTRFFFQAVEPMWEPDLNRVEARFDREVGSDATLAICTDEDSQS